MKVVCLQPALPSYRLSFFEKLAAEFDGELEVRYSPTDMGVLTDHPDRRRWEKPIGPLHARWFGLEWQSGVVGMQLADVDVLIVCGAPRTLSTLLIVLRAKAGGTPTLWWGQYWSATTRMWRLRLRLLLMRMVDAVAFYTDAEVAMYRDRFGKRDARPIGAVNNGLDVEPIRAVRREYIASDRPRAILFIGRLTKKANLSLLLTALSDPRLSPVRLEVIGEGAEGEPLKAKSRALGVDVVWHGGLTDEAQIAKVANECRLFCYPGQVGLSLIHAMAYALPAVVHDDRFRHMPEIAAFSEGITGWSFRAGDSAGLAEVLVRSLEDEPGLARASRTAAERADTTFNTTAMASRMIGLINEVAEQRR